MIKAAPAVVLAVLLFAGPAGADAGSDLNGLIDGYRAAEGRLGATARTQVQTNSGGDAKTIAAYAADRERLNQGTLKRLTSLDRNSLNPQDQLTYDIFHWELEDESDELKTDVNGRLHFMPINQFDGGQITFPREMDERAKAPFRRAQDYDAQIRRMLDFTTWVDRTITTMREGMKEGLVEPKVIVERMIAQCAIFADADPDESLFMAPVKTFAPAIAASERARISAAWREAVAGEVIPGYRRLRDFLKIEYLPKARDTIGLSAIPGGKEIYLHLVRSQTTESLSPDAIHALGLSELTRIEGEMETVKKTAGFTGTLDQFRDYLRQDQKFQYRDQAAMSAEFAHVKEVVESHLDQLFSAKPKTDFTFRFYEPYIAADKPDAEYQAGGNGREAAVVLNASDLASRRSYTSEVLELHEGIPGHHLQADYARGNRALSPFRRGQVPPAYVEGWALYAETLGDQLGLYTDPYQKFGALSFDAWRASRLVVDTGIHWFGWTREEAIDFLLKHTTLPRSDATEEVDRYIAVPAQALSYKIGELEILILRDEAKKALGAKFDLKSFHDAVLKDGAMPLPILKAKIERWIAAQS